MVRATKFLLALFLAGCFCALAAASDNPEAQKASSGSLAERTAAMRHWPGLLGLDWDAKAGKLYLEVPLTGNADHTRSADFLFAESLPYGMGSNDIGLDRGQISAGRLVHFERTGPKLLLIEPNAEFRTSSTEAAAQMVVTQSFPASVMAGLKVEAEGPDGTVLVDATDFFLSDVHHVSEALAGTGQGAYRVDVARSTIALDATKAFPKNTEVEAELTFAAQGDASREKAPFVHDVTPDPRSITVREHVSFLELPPPGFTPRRFSPRAGYFPMTWRDYDTPLGVAIDQQFITRHRLIKKDPNCTRACEAVTPIQYYVDRGAPPLMREALVEGARWWDEAFQAAGWAPGTFRVDLLPEGADPMDVRYNMIQWVHRYTRGWSYGSAVVDPRTGEIVKGNVTLGSLRGRQDYLIAEALTAPYAKGRPLPDAEGESGSGAALQMVLQRIRQLSAHETGHTLGLSHNFAASSFPHSPEQTVSVMDYPHPWITLNKDGVPDVSHAYPAGIGIWDKVAIDYGYREFDRGGKPVEDAVGLDKILHDSEQTGLIYITDEDARPQSGAHPHAHLWDNGTDPAAELDRVLAVRTAALERFGEDAIREGTPLAQLEDTLVLVYLFHRYQTEAAVKEIGGLDYRYNVRGDGQMTPQVVAPDAQRAALAAVVKTLSPETLTLPERLLRLLPPRTPGLPRTRESLAAHTGLTFDPVASAESAADLTLGLLFNAERANRLVEYHARDGAEPSLDDVIRATLEATAVPAGAPGLTAEVKRAVDGRIVEALLGLAGNPVASEETRGTVRLTLQALREDHARGSEGKEDQAFRALEVARIDEFFRDPAKFVPAKPIAAPPGMPIGDEE
jgi:hypothetical protein